MKKPDPTPAPIQRVDVLANTPRTRFRGLRGRVTDDAADDVLDAIVGKVAAVHPGSAVVVMLVLERTQRFRASVGMPADLTAAGATDRTAGLCQYVVRDGAPFFVEDTAARTDLPHLGAHAPRRYLGVPIHIDGDTVGALCVLGGAPAPLADHEVEQLNGFAAQVSARLGQLAGPLRNDSVELATTPVFGELRNALVGTLGAGAAVRFIAADLAPVQRALRAGAWTAMPLLADAAGAIEELTQVSVELDEGNQRVRDGVLLLQGALASSQAPERVTSVLRRARGLAHHATKVRGGVHLRSEVVDDAELHVAGVVANVVAIALTELAAGAPRDNGVVVDVAVVDDVVTLRLDAGGSPGDAGRCVTALRSVNAGVELEADGGAIVIRAAVIGSAAPAVSRSGHTSAS